MGEGQVWLEHAGFFTSYSKIDRENDDQLADLELDGFSRSKTYRDILAIFIPFFGFANFKIVSE